MLNAPQTRLEAGVFGGEAVTVVLQGADKPLPTVDQGR